MFPVVPAASPTQIFTRAQLAETWTGLSRSRVQQSQIRQGLWGGYGAVEAELIMPDLPTFPIGAPLPFHFRVTTHTKPLKHDEHPLPEGEGMKPLFPAPPAGPSSIEFRLDRALRIVARGRRSAYTTDAIPALGGMGPGASRQTGEVVQVDRAEPEWVPATSDEKSSGEKGMWRRTVSFTGTLLFACPPSLETTTLTCQVCASRCRAIELPINVWSQYIMHINVPFPGIGNNLKWSLPVVLDSGVGVPPPAFGDAGPSSYGQHVYDQPLVLDLPPYVLQKPMRNVFLALHFATELTLLARIMTGKGTKRVDLRNGRRGELATYVVQCNTIMLLLTLSMAWDPRATSIISPSFRPPSLCFHELVQRALLVLCLGQYQFLAKTMKGKGPRRTD